MVALAIQEAQGRQLLDLGSDIGLRNKYFVRASYAHPAKLHLGLLAWIIERYTRPGDTICDPMAGIGSLVIAATMQRNVILREIEPRWLSIAHENAAHIQVLAGMFSGSIDVAQADAREAWGLRADAVIFSPPYGCDFTAVSPLSRRGYIMPVDDDQATKWKKKVGTGQVFVYGQHPAQIGAFRDTKYWTAMRQIYKRAREALPAGGVMALVIKDHIRAGKRVRVADQTVEVCGELGFRLWERHARRVYPLGLWQRRRKERGEPVVEEEDVLAFRRLM